MILINGEQTEQWFVTDRAFLYGDGCFTTMLVKLGKIQHWSAHVARLQRDTFRLSIKNVDWSQLEINLTKITKEVQNQARAVVKIVISRGSGGQGYSAINCNSPTIVISSHAYPRHYLDWQKKGITLALLKQRIGLSPLAGIKHLNRLEQVLMKQELEQLNADDAVVCCINGHVIETTSGNIFWRKKNTLYTPNLSMAGVLGTQRTMVIKAAAELNLPVEEVIATHQSLFDADEVFICNALMELVPVRKIANIIFEDNSLCKKLMLRLT